MIVMKFGGSSVANAERIMHVAEIIKMFINKNPIVVTSAMGKTTDNLLTAANEALSGHVSLEEISELHLQTAKELQIDSDEIEILINELNGLLSKIVSDRELLPETKDYLISFGERLSARVVAAYLNKIGLRTKAYDAWDIGFTSDSNFTDSELISESYEEIANSLGALKSDYSYTPLITGFIAKDKNGKITTLGRGGSDLTASVIGKALNVEEIQVWKDVDGILTTDPRLVQNALPVRNISFEEASELAYFGAKVLHPRSIIPAMEGNIPVRVKNSYNPLHSGTLILNELTDANELLRVITFKRNVTLIDVVSSRMLGQYGFLAKVFQIFDEHRVSVDMLATSEVSISLTLDNKVENLPQLKKELDKIARVNIRHDKTMITLIGNIKRSSEILGKTFDAMLNKDINVQMISHGASKVNTSFIIDDSQTEVCVMELHNIFFGQHSDNDNC